MSKPKLIIHETDCHGKVFIHYNDTIEYYCYDDGSWGDVKATIKKLIDIGFIDKNDVVIFDNSYDVYKIVEKGLMNND